MAGITLEPPDVQHVAREAAGVRAGGPKQRHLARAWARTGALAAGSFWTLPATGRWTWGSSALLAVVLLHPYLLVLAVQDPAVDRVSAAGAMSLLLVQLAVLASAVILTYDWRISRRAVTGWLGLTLSFMAAQHVPFALLAVEGSPEGRYGYLLGVAQLPSSLVVLALVGLAMRGARLPVRNPLATGLLLGGLVGATRFVLIDTGIDPTLRLTHGAGLAVVGLVTVAMAGIIVLLVRSSRLPAWARARLVVFTACVVVGRALSTGRGHDAPSPLAVAFAVLGAVALGSAAAALLRQTINDNSRRLVNLSHRAASAEMNVRHGQEKMHELHATVAGVAQASRLLIQNGGPTGTQRRRLESLLDSEMRRLERMLTRRGQQSVGDVCLDDVLLPLVETQRALGHDVRYLTSGLRAVGRPDDIAEATHILLSNAARHAPNALVTVTTIRRDDCLEIRVSDNGPGIPAGLRQILFEWGARSKTSPGQGIGLQLAKRLMTEQSGNLRLESEGRLGGATFVLTIPASPPGLT
jgi:signal transduction histidine kinase